MKDGTELSVVSAYFTISAYEALREELERVEGMRFLYGAPQHLRALARDKRPARAFGLTERGLAPSRQLTQRADAKRCAAWIRRKAEIRSVKDDLLHGKLFHVQGTRADALIGSSNFTLPGLGLHERKNVELNLVVDSDRDRNDLLAWFEEWWTDDQRTEDVKDRVLRELELLHRNHSPAFIYLSLTLFHIFGAELADLAGTDEDVDRRGLGRSEIWRSLFEFQREAVKIVIDRVKRLNGCILADSVGLGLPGNPLLAEPMYLLRYIEKMGTGIVDMIRRCAEAGLPEPEFDVGVGFAVRIWRPGGATTRGASSTARGATPKSGRTTRKTGETTQETRPTTQETTQETAPTTQETTQETAPTTQKTVRDQILDHLKAEPGLTRKELVDLTPDGVKYHLDNLRAAGAIRRVGSTKAGRWEVL